MDCQASTWSDYKYHINKYKYKYKYQVISTISSQPIFSYEKILSIKKHLTSKNQLTKQKYVNEKQRKQQFFPQKNSERGEVVYFSFWCFFYAQNLFVKK